MESIIRNPTLFLLKVPKIALVFKKKLLKPQVEKRLVLLLVKTGRAKLGKDYKNLVARGFKINIPIPLKTVE